MGKPVAVGIILFFLAVFGICIYFFSQLPQQPYHSHADLLVILNGNVLDLNKPYFMSTEVEELSPDVHVHDLNPFVVHFHRNTATFGEFFRSIGMDINDNCFFDGNSYYCTNSEAALQFYVNERKMMNISNLAPNDLDKVLIFYGPGEPTALDYNSVTSMSCIYSEKCPAPKGFVFPAESCAGKTYCSVE